MRWRSSNCCLPSTVTTGRNTPTAPPATMGMFRRRQRSSPEPATARRWVELRPPSGSHGWGVGVRHPEQRPRSRFRSRFRGTASRQGRESRGGYSRSEDVVTALAEDESQSRGGSDHDGRQDRSGHGMKDLPCLCRLRGEDTALLGDAGGYLPGQASRALAGAAEADLQMGPVTGALVLVAHALLISVVAAARVAHTDVSPA